MDVYSMDRDFVSAAAAGRYLTKGRYGPPTDDCILVCPEMLPPVFFPWTPPPPPAPFAIAGCTGAPRPATHTPCARARPCGCLLAVCRVSSRASTLPLRPSRRPTTPRPKPRSPTHGSASNASPRSSVRRLLYLWPQSSSPVRNPYPSTTCRLLQILRLSAAVFFFASATAMKSQMPLLSALASAMNSHMLLLSGHAKSRREELMARPSSACRVLRRAAGCAAQASYSRPRH
ncbi:hypothetical protein EJB05_05329, partial [Eragrostis curvula]